MVREQIIRKNRNNLWKFVGIFGAHQLFEQIINWIWQNFMDFIDFFANTGIFVEHNVSWIWQLSVPIEFDDFPTQCASVSNQ